MFLLFEIGDKLSGLSKINWSTVSFSTVTTAVTKAQEQQKQR